MSTWKRTLKLGFLMAFASVAASACSSSDDDGAVAGDENEVNSSKCGGIAGLQCKAGYNCIVASSMPDAMGSCKKAPECGGFAGLSCPANFHCVMPDSKVFDQAGTCVENKTLPATDSCGGCATGLKCSQCRTTSGVKWTCIANGEAC